MDYRTAVKRLQRAMSRPLPGVSAQLRMAPRTPSGAPLRGDRVPDSAARQAAGLVLVFPSDEDIATFVLTERSLDLPAHPGQIGLPAGMKEAAETHENAALREAQEEVGVEARDLRVLGPLTPIYIPPSGILLHPFLSHVPKRPSFRPSVTEVTRIFEIPLAALLDPGSIREESRVLQEGVAVVPYFDFEREKIWGATAMILAEVRALLEESV
jgi:8-oxo-dGTP pyrophosphatase MutT (NUDIX family)